MKNWVSDQTWPYEVAPVVAEYLAAGPVWWCEEGVGYRLLTPPPLPPTACANPMAVSAVRFTPATRAVEESGDYQLSKTEVSLACTEVSATKLLVITCTQSPEMALLAQKC